MNPTNRVYPLDVIRTLALHVQGLTTKLDIKNKPTSEMIYNIIKCIGCLQIDTLSVVQRSQYLVLWSRLGQYNIDDSDKLLFGDQAGNGNNRRLFEYWLHGASIIPLDGYRYRLPVMRKYKEQGDKWNQGWSKKKENVALMNNILERIKRDGPIRSADFENDGPKRGSWWDWKPAKQALEQLYNRGDLMIANRINFQRIYDLRERVLPDWVNTSEPSSDETIRYLLESALLSLGVCQKSQIADYTHMRRTKANSFIENLIADAVFIKIQACLSDHKAHELLIHRDNISLLERIADRELKARRTTFLSPFDSLFWAKGRDVQLWNFSQVLEAYKPESSRKWGYFCLPILYHDKLVGRFDPKLNRKTNTLHIKALYLEPNIQLDEKLVNAVAGAMRDFMKFHNATDLIIERSEPLEFRNQLLSNFTSIR